MNMNIIILSFLLLPLPLSHPLTNIIINLSKCDIWYDINVSMCHSDPMFVICGCYNVVTILIKHLHKECANLLFKRALVALEILDIWQAKCYMSE